MAFWQLQGKVENGGVMENNNAVKSASREWSELARFCELISSAHQSLPSFCLLQSSLTLLIFCSCFYQS